MKKTLNPFKIKIDYPSNRPDFKYVKEIERYCFNHGLNFNKRYLVKVYLVHKHLKHTYNFLLATEPEES